MKKIHLQWISKKTTNTISSHNVLGHLPKTHRNQRPTPTSPIRHVEFGTPALTTSDLVVKMVLTVVVVPPHEHNVNFQVLHDFLPPRSGQISCGRGQDVFLACGRGQDVFLACGRGQGNRQLQWICDIIHRDDFITVIFNHLQRTDSRVTIAVNAVEELAQWDRFIFQSGRK